MFNTLLISLCEEVSGEVCRILPSDLHKLTRPTGQSDIKADKDCDLIIVTVHSLSQLTVQQLDRLLGQNVPVIVVCKSCRLEVSIQLIRYGVVDCIPLNGNLAGDLQNACLKATKLSARRGERDNCCLSVVSSYSTADTSMLASNVATLVAQLNGGSLLVDLNFRGSEAPTYFGVPPTNNIQHLFVDKNEIDDQLIEKAFVQHSSGVQLLGGPATFANVETTDLFHVDAILKRLAERSRMVVLVENPIHIELLSTLKIARRTIVTTQMNIVALRKAKHCIDLLRIHGVQPNSICVAALDLNQTSAIPFKYVSQLLEVEEVVYIPVDVAECSLSLNMGTPTCIRAPNSDFSTAIRRNFCALTGYRLDDSADRKQPNRILSLWQNFVQRQLGDSPMIKQH